MYVTLLDDVDDVPRTAAVLAERPGRMFVRFTCDVVMTHVQGRTPAESSTGSRRSAPGQA